jgi:hypothetical protein
MTLLILLNILLMIFFALLGLSGSAGQNWFYTQSLETRGVRNPTTRGPSGEKDLGNAQPLLEQEQNGIDFNDPKGRNNVIYL